MAELRNLPIYFEIDIWALKTLPYWILIPSIRTHDSLSLLANHFLFAETCKNN